MGNSGLAIAPLVLGGNVFGWTADRAAGFAVLDAFVAGGGTMIDTADVYSAWVPGHVGGESETLIGEWLRHSGRRDDVLIATKVGMLAGDGGDGLAPARIAAAVDASLRRLGTDRIDLYFAHRDDPAVPLAEPLDAFDRLVRAGKVRAIGASNFTGPRLDEAANVAAANGLTAFSVVQPHYNLLERTDFETTLLPVVRERGLGVMPYYGLAAGFLTGKYRRTVDLTGVRGAGAGQYLNARGLAVLGALDLVAARHAANPARIALAWLMAKPCITAPIASATSAAQVTDLVAAMHITLTADDIAALDAAGG
ncbi:oxidoreductase [Sphingomonas prati]|uniref:Aryl-alcohol dehydrogenase-like predicted oxidoreductase n=1 Tax=Sphingomonas prati TaxID=1843237 RepID=A0A7W9BPQ1_9SPHN|nr:aryl-alcohol dehydrogenase-like predicted oxidoreductase [Sphingomonas prati]GGE81245.1 oxidoreductase [Sphingomonas prati]